MDMHYAAAETFCARHGKAGMMVQSLWIRVRSNRSEEEPAKGSPIGLKVVSKAAC
jgi:hypothetical protein